MPDEQSPLAASTPEDFPVANVRDETPRQVWRRRLSRVWWLTLVCAVIAAVLAVGSLRDRGTRIVIRFLDGHGIQPGDLMRHRGIEVGEVTAVRLQEDLAGVAVEVILSPTARKLATEGSRFWIERPQLSLTRSSGLDTVVGAKYVNVIPGDLNGARKTEFQGIETPPTLREPAGVELTIRFSEGHGLQVGDVLQYRGIRVGEVAEIRLSTTMAKVEARVRLVEFAKGLARAGSRFWIERATIDVNGVRGLETIVGGRYLAVLPGPPDAPQQYEFEAVSVPPIVVSGSGDSLEVTLVAQHRHGIQRGTPIFYRGFHVGQIVSVGLSSDSVAVEARAVIDGSYRDLVRDNSRFWNTSGFDLRIGLRGIQLDTETLTTLARGGVAFATPTEMGKEVFSGHRFSLATQVDDAWLNWSPRIAAGSAVSPRDHALPQPIRAVLNWQTKRFYITRSYQKHAWLLPLESNRLLGPLDLFQTPEGANDGTVALEIDGRRVQLTTAQLAKHGQLGVVRLGEFTSDRAVWPASSTRRPTSIEDCLLTVGPHQPPLAIGTGNLKMERQSWRIDPSVSFDDDWHGASVVALADGQLIGTLLVQNGGGTISLVPAELMAWEPAAAASSR